MRKSKVLVVYINGMLEVLIKLFWKNRDSHPI
jgi:hypothetical protein